MPKKIGRFEVLGEIAGSPIGCVYKASDPESGQTVALKTISLNALGDQAEALVHRVLEETETSKALNSHNIALLYGAGDLEGLFCAAAEYVQGNSVATMLARQEGFSIWDIQDIARQTCQGLDHAHAHGAVHHSLEPAKIMVQWDGTVKILAFGISTMSLRSAQGPGPASEILHYMSPEQLQGNLSDVRSNIFSLGAILYEMATERKAFNGDDEDQVRRAILEMTPVAPDQVNRKTSVGLSEVIMKALAKVPEERYQSGQELITALEKCKSTVAKAAVASAGNRSSERKKARQEKQASAAAANAIAKTTSAQGSNASGANPAPPAMKLAAAAGWDGSSARSTSPGSAGVTDLPEAATLEQAVMSAASPAEAEVEVPPLQVDPLMTERDEPTADAPSFSEIDELPPLKEVAFEAAVPELDPVPQPDPVPTTTAGQGSAQPSRAPRGETAKKAITEIRKTPPRLFLYAIAAAAVIILVIAGRIAMNIRSENAEEEGASMQSSAPATATTQPQAAPIQTPSPAPAPGAQTSAPQPAPETVAAHPEPISVVPRYSKKKAVKTPSPPPAVVPGQLNVNSTPEGAQIHVDGQTDPSWVTPYNLPGLQPGQHTVSVSKIGYASETRTIEVGSASKSFLVVQLAQMSATVSVTSQPAGATVFVDGKDTGRLTPAEVTVDKSGTHTLTVRKQGYLEETTTANLQAGQTFYFAPALRALGSTQDIKTVSKFKKVFGGGDTAGMGSISIKTQPKGAQIAVNNRVLDKGSPAEFYLNPGNYMIDITLSGYKPVHRVINLEKSGKVAIDETLERE